MPESYLFDWEWEEWGAEGSRGISDGVGYMVILITHYFVHSDNLIIINSQSMSKCIEVYI